MLHLEVLHRGAHGRSAGHLALLFWASQWISPSRYFRSSTTTDFGGSVAFRLPDSIAAPVKAAGFTTAGWSNVLWALIAAAVSTRPVTPVSVPPGICAVVVTGRLGFTFTSSTCRWPSFSRTAEALTSGNVEASLLYQAD